MCPPQVLNVILKERVLQKNYFLKKHRGVLPCNLTGKPLGNTGPAVAFPRWDTWTSGFFEGCNYPRLFVVTCNTVCTVCIKNRKKEKKKGIDLYCRLIFIQTLDIVTQLIFYCSRALPPCWYFFNSDVAFVLRQIFIVIFRKIFC